MAIILSNFNRFSKYFSLEDSLVNLQQSRVVNNQIKTGLLLTLCVVILCTLCAWLMNCRKTKKVHETTTFLLATLLNVRRF